MIQVINMNNYSSFITIKIESFANKTKSLEITLLSRYIRLVPDSAGVAYKFHISVSYLLRFGVRMNAGAS